MDRDGFYNDNAQPMSNVDVNSGGRGSVMGTRPPSRLNVTKLNPTQRTPSPRNGHNFVQQPNKYQNEVEQSKPRVIQVNIPKFKI